MELRDLQRLAPRALRHRGSRDQVSPGTYLYPAGTPSRQGVTSEGLRLLLGWFLQVGSSQFLGGNVFKWGRLGFWG